MLPITPPASRGCQYTTFSGGNGPLREIAETSREQFDERENVDVYRLPGIASAFSFHRQYDHDNMTIVVRPMKMKKMAAGAFKAKCLSVMDEVQAKREAVIITKRGKPVAKLVPVNEGADEIFDFFAGKGVVVGDIVSPVLSAKEWGDLK